MQQGGARRGRTGRGEAGQDRAGARQDRAGQLVHRMAGQLARARCIVVGLVAEQSSRPTPFHPAPPRTHRLQFYEGRQFRGIGSPHTPPDMVWPLAISVQGLTAARAEERAEMLRTILKMQCGNGLMHESGAVVCGGLDSVGGGVSGRVWAVVGL